MLSNLYLFSRAAVTISPHGQHDSTIDFDDIHAYRKTWSPAEKSFIVDEHGVLENILSQLSEEDGGEVSTRFFCQLIQLAEN